MAILTKSIQKLGLNQHKSWGLKNELHKGGAYGVQPRA